MSFFMVFLWYPTFFFFIFVTLSAFIFRLLNVGWKMLVFFPFYLIFLLMSGCIAYLLFDFIRFTQKEHILRSSVPTELSLPLWLYVWVQFFALLVDIDYDDAYFYPTLFGFLPWLKQWWRTHYGMVSEDVFVFLAKGLFFLQAVLFLWLVMAFWRQKRQQGHRS